MMYWYKFLSLLSAPAALLYVILFCFTKRVDKASTDMVKPEPMSPFKRELNEFGSIFQIRL